MPELWKKWILKINFLTSHFEYFHTEHSTLKIKRSLNINDIIVSLSCKLIQLHLLLHMLDEEPVEEHRKKVSSANQRQMKVKQKSVKTCSACVQKGKETACYPHFFLRMIFPCVNTRLTILDKRNKFSHCNVGIKKKPKTQTETNKKPNLNKIQCFLDPPQESLK